MPSLRFESETKDDKTPVRPRVLNYPVENPYDPWKSRITGYSLKYRLAKISSVVSVWCERWRQKNKNDFINYVFLNYYV